jgi:transposase/broad specificity phosphatase PhoE
MMHETPQERAMQVQEVILRTLNGQYQWHEAAEILGISERTIYRWKWRYERHGYNGLYDRRRQRPSPKRVPVAVVQQVLALYRERYRGWNVAHVTEQLRRHHGIRLSYSWIKAALQGAGLVAKRRQRGGHRQRRPRRPLPGMLLFQDASTHAWWPTPTGSRQDLLVIMDDATSVVYDAVFIPQENTASCLAQLRGVVERHGVFCSLYTDKGSHFVTTRTGQSPHHPQQTAEATQVQRALRELGIQLILANSPEARGRIERLFGTWQGRLPQELRRHGIRGYAAANRFLRRAWLPYHRRHWTVPATQPGTAFVPCARRDLDRVFALQHERTVAHDNTLQYGRRTFQLVPSRLRVSFAKCRVTVYEHLDGHVSIGYGPHTLGRYTTEGTGRTGSGHAVTHTPHNGRTATSHAMND